mmetsp:Transcript_74178/g.176685  ORF Transcript_74178/g.176685 Transcript_74178/m.176685 type:complete len:267 (+) Transcript_74178:95-895(+)
MQQGGAIAVFPQNCSPAQVGGFAQAFVVVPQCQQWTAAQQQQPQHWCNAFMAAPAPVATHCAPSHLEQQQEVKAAAKDSVALIGGVFGIAGVSKLPAACSAGKGNGEKAKSSRRRPRTSTGTNIASIVPAHQQQQQQITEGALPTTAKKSSDRKQTRATTAPTLAAKVAPQQLTPELVEEVSSPVTVTCSSSSSSPAGSWQQFEKRAGRRWADIADEEEEDVLSSHASDCGVWDSKCGSHSFSDVASTRGSSTGDCTDTESSEDDA